VSDSHHEESFWRKYIFSTDHKIIGLQYGITALMFLFFALPSCLTAQNFLTKPVKKDSTTSVNLGPAVLPVSSIRFQYWINDYLSLNAGLSHMLAAGDFNAEGNVHLPMKTFNTYFGPRRIFFYHLFGALDLSSGVVLGLKLKRFL